MVNSKTFMVVDLEVYKRDLGDPHDYRYTYYDAIQLLGLLEGENWRLPYSEELRYLHNLSVKYHNFLDFKLTSRYWLSSRDKSDKSDKSKRSARLLGISGMYTESTFAGAFLIIRPVRSLK